MITIVSGTNRPNSNSAIVARQYKRVLEAKNQPAQILNLEDLPNDFVFSAAFGNESTLFNRFVEDYVSGIDRFVFVVPEYNGSFPGVLKCFLDCVPPPLFRGKKAALIGLSAGQAGNLRGMDDLTGILHYLRVEVLSQKPKLSKFEHVANIADGQITDERSLHLLDEHADSFLKF